jgi:hypothetical protein
MYSDHAKTAAKIAAKESFLSAQEILEVAAVMIPNIISPDSAKKAFAIQEETPVNDLAKKFAQDCENLRGTSYLKDILGE